MKKRRLRETKPTFKIESLSNKCLPKFTVLEVFFPKFKAIEDYINIPPQTCNVCPVI